jgi:hypothetical protein
VKHIHQIAAVAVASGVAVASLGLPSASAASHAAAAKHSATAKHSVTTTNSAAAAAGYLARQLVGKHHDHYTGTFPSGKKTITYVNYGETADAILSMDAAGVAQTAATRATKYLEANVKKYAGKSAGTFAPGPIGKLMLVAEAQHANLHAFGGLDLVAAVRKTEGARGAAAGEYQQNPAGTPVKFDYTSTTSQALAMLGLADTATSSGQPDAAAVSFLIAQQCGNGGFPTEILANPKSACSSEPKDVDSTGYAVQALLAAGAHAAAGKAIGWLMSAEHKNGAFGQPGNANSTALAVQALIAAHHNVAKSEAWLASRQVGCSGAAARRGAVALQKKYDSSALLATSQAGAALAGRPLAWIDKFDATGPSPVLSCHKK